jgi:hypothetical protein
LIRIVPSPLFSHLLSDKAFLLELFYFFGTVRRALCERSRKFGQLDRIEPGYAVAVPRELKTTRGAFK